MSTAANQITEQTIMPTPEQRRRGKPSAEERISELIAELKVVRRENADLLDRLAAFEIAESTRKKEQQAAMNQFIAKCEAVSKVQPGFDDCLRAISGVPESWLQEIVSLPNGPGFVVFLGSNSAVLDYLRELKPEAAITRLRQFAFDVHHKLPRFEGK